MLRSALLILSGNAFASLLLLARNLLVARMIPLADYGMASTFALVMAVVEMASAFGLQQQIVQAKDGDDPHFQAVLQGFQLLRGCVSGAALFVLAGPMADFMAIPEVTWAYRLLALVPVLNALVHFDIHRLNRHMVFWPMILTGALPALVSVLVLWPLAHWFGDWRVMLYAILVQAFLSVLVSHLVAKRRWRLAFDAVIIGQSLRFGWPLLANAALLFLVFQGDRMIVGRELGMTTLAVFSMGLTLTLTPTLVLAKSIQNFFLPRLARIEQTTEEGVRRFQAQARMVLQAALLNGLVIVAAMAIGGPVFVHWVLGEKYDALLPLLLPFALLTGVRVFKSGPAVVSLAQGHTGNAMIANLPRVGALLLAWAALQAWGRVIDVIWIGLAAELFGYALALLVMQGPRLRYLALPISSTLAAMAGLLVIWALWQRGELAAWVPMVLALPLLALPLLTMRDMWHLVATQIGKSKVKSGRKEG